MVLIVVGLVILGIGVHYALRSRTPAGAESLAGRVVDVSMKRSSLTGSATRLYAPTVEYRDPRTGEPRVLPPASHQPRAYRVGEKVTLVRDATTGEVRLPLPRPGLQMTMPFVFGVLMIALGVLDLRS